MVPLDVHLLAVEGGLGVGHVDGVVEQVVVVPRDDDPLRDSAVDVAVLPTSTNQEEGEQSQKHCLGLCR